MFNMTFAPEFFRLISDVWKSVRRLRVDVTMQGEEVSETELPLGGAKPLVTSLFF